MANRYANLTPSALINQEYMKITEGFDKVQNEVDELQNKSTEMDEKITELIKGHDLDPNKDLEVIASRTSSEFGTFETLPDRLNNTDRIINSQLTNPQYSSVQEVIGGIGNMPENLVEGQINDAIIEGLTAINLVKNGNFSDGTTNWFTDGANLSVNSNMMNVKGNGSSKYCFLGQKISTSVAGKKYFLRAKVRVTNSQCTRIVLYGYSDNNIRADAKTLNSPVQNQEYSLYGIADFSNGTGAFSLLMYHEYADASTATDKIMEVKEVFVKELTGEDLALTADQINLKYLHWFDGTKSVLASLRKKTVAKNLFDGKKIKYYGNGSGYVKFNEDEQKIEILRLDGGAHEGFTFDFEAQIGQIYTLSFNVISNPTSLSIAVIDPDSNVNLYSTGYFSNIGSKTLTFVATKRKLTIKSYNGTSNNSPTIIQYLQLQAGSVVTGYKEYKETVQYISAKDSQGNLIELRSLPNGVKDAINTQNNKLIKKISEKYILDHSWFTKATTNNPEGFDLYRAQDLFTIRGFPVGMIGINEPLNATILTVDGAVLTRKVNRQLLTNVNEYSTDRSGNGLVDLIVPTGQDFESVYGGKEIAFIYQLATPQEIFVSVDGTLQAFEDGSIYIEPYLKEEFSITGTSINLPIPISAIDKIEILQNGVWLETTGTLSSDGKTISVSNTGKYRVFGPIKSEESLIPEVTYTVPVNLKAQVNANTKAISSIGEKIIDLNDKVDILLILNS